MYIRNLVEDTKQSKEHTELNYNVCKEKGNGLQQEHGLSFYIETQKHKILFDLGASDLFLGNAKILGIDLEKVDVVIISHGHYDHGGGISSFLKINHHAKIFIREEAFGNFYSKRLDKLIHIGLDPALKEHPQVIMVKGDLKIDDQLFLYGDVIERDLWPKANCNLKMKLETQEKYIQDTFLHEHNLVISEGNKKVLFCGCAHNGIVNIMKRFEEIFKCCPNGVIGGFHLINPRNKNEVDEDLVKQTAEYLIKNNTQYFTCHCTGMEAFNILKNNMKDRIAYIGTGGEIQINCQ